MSNSHHGMPEKRGTKLMTSHGRMKKENKGERFGRLFPYLAPLYTNPNDLQELGKKGGVMDADGDKKTTKNVPLGFVFLGQFIDHDITLDVTSSLSRVNDPNATENFRTPALDLDCVYGGGPEASRHLYDHNRERVVDPSDEKAVAKMQKDNGVYLLTGADFPEDLEEHQQHDLIRNPAGQALIGDFRNDENRVISQLQLAFIKFHNYVVNYVKAEAKKKDCEISGSELFEEAQRLVRWHYQWMIVNEFLPTMVGEKLVNDILGRGRQFYTPKKGPFIPIEFSAAAYRFGHSMVPLELRVKDKKTLEAQKDATFHLFSDDLGKGFSAVKSMEQVVDWPVFFQMVVKKKPQLADRLDTKLATDLLALEFIKNDENSLAVRNLKRGQSFLLPSGELIAEEMKHKGIVTQDQLDAVQAKIKEVLKYKRIDIDSGTPLWFYILAEADVLGPDGNSGEGLGPVGGRIVAETLIGLLECDKESYLSTNRDWTPEFANGKNEFGMAELLSYKFGDPSIS